MIISTEDHAVELLYADYEALADELARRPSALASLNRSYHKHLLVAAASSLEDLVKSEVEAIFTKQGDIRLGTFIAKQVMARGYHSLFDWKNGSAKGFFSSFGTECAAAFKEALQNDEKYYREHEAFMLLGNLRNHVVHNDYAGYTIDLTPNEVIVKYRLGTAFIDSFERLILPS